MNIITISREFGSGGREVGKRIADILGYAYYDREIITAIAEKHDFNENYVESMLENGFSFCMPITCGRTFSYSDVGGQLAIQLLSTQCRMLREIASKGNCVIVGRSANIILEDMNPLNIFVHADIESKLRRCRERAPENENLKDSELRRKIKQIDSNRAKHQRFLSEKKWGDKEGYHLCVNTSGADIKAISSIIAEYAKGYFESK